MYSLTKDASKLKADPLSAACLQPPNSMSRCGTIREVRCFQFRPEIDKITT